MYRKINKTRLIISVFLLLTTLFGIKTVIFGGSTKEIIGTDEMPTQSELMNLEESGLEIISDDSYIFEREYELSDTDEGIDIKLEEKETLKSKEKTSGELEEKYYTIKKGDSLYKIARKLGEDMDILIANNPKVKTGVLQIGQKLVLLSKKGIYYNVKKGDTLGAISNKYKIKIATILDENNLNNTNLVVGEKLFLPNPDMNYIKKKNKPVYAKSNIKSRTKGFAWPIKWKGVTSPFGKRFHPVLKKYILHAGVDLRAAVGVPIYAPKDGKITYAGWMGGYGKLIKLKHSGGYSTRYGHLSKIYVKNGQYIKKGQLIGKTGSTGRVTGPHLHYEIRKNGRPLDPMRFR